MSKFVTFIQLIPKDVTFKSDDPNEGLSEEEATLKRLGLGKYQDDEDSGDREYIVRASLEVGRWEEKIIKIDPEIIDIVEETDIGVMIETASGRNIHIKGEINEIERVIDGLGGAYK